MEGARWSREQAKIVESQKKILYDQIPPVFFSKMVFKKFKLTLAR